MNNSLTSLTLYDLMAEDYTVWMTKNKKFGYDIQIEQDKFFDEGVIAEGINEGAIESFAAFCRNFLFCLEHIQNQEYADLFKKVS